MSEIIISSLAFVVLNFSPVYLGKRLADHFYSELGDSARLCLSLSFAIAFVILVFLLTASLKVFILPVVIVICLISIIIASRSLKQGKSFVDIIKFFFSLHPVTRAISLLASLLFFWELTRALLIQPMAWDSMTYHLFFAASWIQEGGVKLFSFPGGIDGYSHFPINGEILSAWQMLAFHSDLSANLGNFPAWILAIVAVYALARECELSADLSVLVSLLLCFSPMLFELLNTSYVDILVFSALTTAILFFIKFIKTSNLKYATVSGLACGLAVGTKLSAAYVSFILFLLIFIRCIYLLKIKKVELADFMKAISIACILAALVGGYRYFLNFIETGNPLYPFAFLNFEASGYKTKVIEDIFARVKSSGIATGYFSGFLKSFEIEGRPMFWVGSRKFLFFGLFSLYFFFNLKKQQHIYKKASLLIISFLPIYLIFASKSPDLITTRVVWPHLTARLAASSLALLAVLGVKVMYQNIEEKKVIIFLSLIILIDLYNSYMPEVHLLNILVLYFNLLIISFLAYQIVTSSRAKSLYASFFSLYAVALIIVLSFAFYHADYFRTKTKSEYYSTYKDDFSVPNKFRGGWDFANKLPGSKTIALATGWWQYGHNWFLFPLMGRHFENKVVYASINRETDLPTSADSGLLREEASRDIWLSNLKKKNVDYLYLQRPETFEHQWVRELPERFKPVYSDKYVQIYRALS